MLWCVGFRRGNPPCRRRSRERSAALATELLRGGVGCATGRAYRGQPRPALPTELHGGEVLVLAPRAIHAASPPTGGAGPGREMRADPIRHPAARTWWRVRGAARGNAGPLTFLCV